MNLVKIGHTVYAACIDDVNDVGYVLPITIVSDKFNIRLDDGEHMRYAHRKWMNNLILDKQVKVYQSRRRAEMQLNLRNIT
jgi:hypothetical protein